jgi:YD repeat-containing protein
VEDYEGQPASAFATPEGHNVEYDGSGRVIGVTLTNVRWLLDRDGEITITWPAGHVSAEDLSEALRTAT